MAKMSLKPKKSLGQHFLMHARIAERIANTAHLAPSDIVFEIGPGTGKLTRALLARAKKVIALETDRALFSQLEQTFVTEIKAGALELIAGDIQTFAIEKLPQGYSVVANIPYYLTGDILRTFLSAKNQPRSMTLLVQKEVALRIARSKKESILSLSVKAYGTPAYAFTVPRGAFMPSPKVDSAVLTISDISRSHFSTKKEEQRFFDLVHAGFAHKRKMLGGNLASSGVSVRAELLKKRPEDLALTDWLSLAKG